MARSSAQARDNQQQGYRTEPSRARFQPAASIFNRGRGREEEGNDNEEEEPRGQRRPLSQQQPSSSQGPVTKSGYPDRRFKGQRDLPPPEEENADFRRARTGGTIGDMHVTIDGKPDRRFKENRGLSDEDVMRRWVQTLNEQFGGQSQRK